MSQPRETDGAYFFLYKKGKHSPRKEPFTFVNGWCGPLIFRDARIGQGRTGADIVASDVTADEILAAFGLVEPSPEAKAAILERLGCDCAQDEPVDSAAAEITDEPDDEPEEDTELKHHEKVAAIREHYGDDAVRERFGTLSLNKDQVAEAYPELGS